MPVTSKDRLPKVGMRPQDDPLRGYGDVSVGSAGGVGVPLPLRATAIDVEVRGGFATVTTRRTFRNDEARSIEATLTLPVPTDAVVHGLRVVVDGRAVSGVAQARAQARTTYEEAVDAGKTAVLHEEALKGVHVLSVAHVPPGKEVVAELSWSKPLTFAGGDPVLRIPSTVGQVYGRLPLLPADDLVTSDHIVFEATLTVTVDGARPRLDGHGTLDVAALTVSLDAPIDLAFPEGAATSGETRGKAADGRDVVVAVRRGAFGESPLDVEILMDISGSMSEPASNLREASGVSKARVALDGLRSALGKRAAPGDRASIWQFDGRAEHLGEARGHDIPKLTKLVAPPRGTTDIDAALRGAVATGARDVLLVTDGKAGGSLASFAACGKRVFVLLVGANSLEANVGHLAALTGGQILAVGGTDVSEAYDAILGMMRVPGSPATGATATSLPDAIFERRAGAEVEIRWEGVPGAAVEADPVGSYAAALTMPMLTEAAATSVAVAHRLCTHLTSLVMVDEAAERQEGVPNQRKVPLSRPFEDAYAASTGSIFDMAPSMASATLSASGSSRSSKGMGFIRGDMVHRVKGMYANPVRSRLDGGGDAGIFRLNGDTGSRDQVWLKGDWADGSSDVHGGIPDAPTARPPALFAGSVDWEGEANRLSLGDVSGLDPALQAALRERAARPGVKALAERLGKPALWLAIGSMALEAGANRAAARVARKLLAGVGEADLVDLAA